MAERLPAELFPPGEYVADELDARGWTRGDLAEILGKSASNVHDIISGKVNISPETARGLADAFGTSAEVWLSLDSRYRLRDAQASPGTNLRAKIYSKTPVRELLKRNWIEGSTNPEVLASRVCDFLGVTSLDEAPRPLAHAARKSTTYAESSPSQIAWLCQVGRLARGDRHVR